MRGIHILALAGACALLPRPALAQIDPLLFLKRGDPAVLVALDLSSRMQRDLAGRYLDPRVYTRTGADWERSLGVTSADSEAFYRRRYAGLSWLDSLDPVRATVAAIETVGDLQPGYAPFDATTRLALARAALARAIGGSRVSARFGLVVTRQSAPRFELDPAAAVSLLAPDLAAPTETGVAGVWNAVLGAVDSPGSEVTGSGVLVPADAAHASASTLARLLPGPLEPGGLVAAGADGAASGDAPILQLLDDLRGEAARLIDADSSCRNTVAVLVTGGGQEPALPVALSSRAEGFLRLGGRRVPLYVIALAPDAASRDELCRLAAGTGGRYLEIPPEAGDLAGLEALVGRLTAGVNAAVQHAFARFEEVNALPTAEQPLGPPSEYPTAPPVVATVDLENLVTAAGALLPLTRITTEAGALIPQRSNVLFAAGFVLPGFEGRLRAFRVYRPQPDPAGPGGYRFVADGTPIWSATLPAPTGRNIFTVLPGRGLVPFDAVNAPALAPYLRARDPAGLIAAIRALPPGAATNSTPAVLTPPAVATRDDASLRYVEANRDRRELVFVGLDDGMMHAFDARTGLELWAVVPFNLLPRLQRLLDGQPIDAFQHFVAGSPRLADVLVGGEWRTLLVFGEGPGGTFYQAFDVTLDGIADAIPRASDLRVAMLGWFADPGRIRFLWSFPSYAHFDVELGSDGDLAAGATEVEKTVGTTWSTPAVAGSQPGVPSLLLVGSGPLAASVEDRPNRGGTAAGRRVYLLEAASGTLLDSRDVGSDGEGEEQDGCPQAGCGRFKNAVAADPVVVASTPGAPRAYAGDLDGRLWRFDVVQSLGSPGLTAPRLLFAAGGDHPLLSAAAAIDGGVGAVYVLFGSGADTLPLTADRPPSRIFTWLDTAAGATRVGEFPLEASATGGRDERLSALPAAAGQVVFFAATAAARSPCEPPESRVYAMTVTGGAAFDTNGDGRRDSRDSPLVVRLAVGRATAPAAADRHLYVATGDRLQVLGDPAGFNAGPGFVGIRILSWREVRRPPRP